MPNVTKEGSSHAAVSRARRIVVKVGSAVLTDDGQLRNRAFGDIARQIAVLRDEGREVVLVSSGAIAIGSRDLGWDIPSESIPEKQAAAAVGQIGLVELYKKHFARSGRQVGQILVTRGGLEERERFLNARHTLLTLLRSGVIPIVNENDTVATDEIRFGDNDRLSATVVNLVAADLLIILTDVDGLHAEPPTPGRPKPPLYDVIDSVTPEIEHAAQGSSSAFGRGGMVTKLEAAQAAARCGAATVLCNGRKRNAIVHVAKGKAVGTLIRSNSRIASRKHWLAFTTRTRGELVLDEGAVRAIEHGGKSLLPAGIAEIRGRFGIGDAIACLAADGREIGRGLTAYSSDDIHRIAGQGTAKIQQMLGYSNGDEVIHRDDLVLLTEDSGREAPAKALPDTSVDTSGTEG
jgi:glutamate 5-kinase